MTKIRNFKVNLRENAIYRSALKRLGISANDETSTPHLLNPPHPLSLSHEERVAEGRVRAGEWVGEREKASPMSNRALYEGLLSKMRARLKPGTLFDTFPLAKIKGPLSACGAEAPANTVAASLVVASLGHPVEELFSTEGGEETDEANPQEIFLSEMAEDALEQSARFISRILVREAEEEECELAAPLSIQSPEKILLDKKMKGFSLSKIGVTLNSEGVWKPRFSRAYLIFWVSRGKKG